MRKRGYWISILVVLLSCSDDLHNPNILVLGHGGEGFMSDANPHPHNSEISIRRAIFGFGADGVEVDVQMTADSQLVLYHDNRLESSTDQFGWISEMQLDAVTDARYKGALDISSDYPVISVQQLLGILNESERNIAVSLNIQPQREVLRRDSFNSLLARTLEEQLDSIVTARHRFAIECPDREQILSVRTRFNNRTEVKLFYTQEVNEDNIQFCIDNSLNGLVSNYLKSPQNSRELMSSANLEWWVYGVKIESDIKPAIELKPDAIQTDIIPLTLRKLGR